MAEHNFYSVTHNSFGTRGYPWVMEVDGSYRLISHCSTCDRDIRYADSGIGLILENKKGTKWPDVLGCGYHPFLIVSDRVVSSWHKEGIGPFPISRAIVRSPLPKKLVGSIPPMYFWVDGKKMYDVKVDYEASGFVDVKFCLECGTRTDDIELTYDRQNSSEYPGIVFRDGTWGGEDLFASDISHAQFFCTETVLEIAKNTNLRILDLFRLKRKIMLDTKALTTCSCLTSRCS